MKLKARVATLDAPGVLRFAQEDLSSDDLGSGQLLCETLVTAISPGTETAAFRGAPPVRAGVRYPRLVGYCNVARVIACGPGVEGFAVGDRVLSYSSHRSHFIIHSTDVLCRLSRVIRSEDAACAYLFHLGYSAVLKGHVRLGSTVAILGLGALGLCSVAMSAMAGASTFAVSDQADARDRALRLGATAVFSRATVADFQRALGPGLAHTVIATTDAWADWRLALEAAGREGTIAVLGFPGRGGEPIPFNPLDSSHFYDRQLRVVAAGMVPELPDGRGFLPFNERENLHRILVWIESGKLRPAEIVSGEYPGEDVAEAYSHLIRRDSSAGTFILRWAS